MRNRLLVALVAASVVTAAAGVSAQNATPREAATGNPSVNSTLNGSPVGTTPNTTLDYGTNSGWIENDQMRAYMNARNACAAQPPDQQAACESATNRDARSWTRNARSSPGPHWTTVSMVQITGVEGLNSTVSTDLGTGILDASICSAMMVG